MQIDKEKIVGAGEGMRIGISMGLGMGTEAFRRPLPTFPEVDSILSIKDP